MANASDRELLADLKQDESNVYHSNAPQAEKEHVAGAVGKLQSAMAQAEGAKDINAGARELSREVPPSGNEVDRDAIAEQLHKKTNQKIEEHTHGVPMSIQKGSEAARVQSAAEQYDLAREGRQAADGGSQW